MSFLFFSGATREPERVKTFKGTKEIPQCEHTCTTKQADARVGTCLENRAPVPPNRPRSIIIIIIIIIITIIIIIIITMVIIAMVMMMMMIIIIITIIDTIIYILYI